MNEIIRPKIQPITLAEANSFSGRDYIAQEKMDGVFALKQWHGNILAGEQMRDGSFYAFDIANCQGDDCRRSPYKDRLAALKHVATRFDSAMRLPAQGVGQEFLEAVLARGGEGVVFKHVDGYWGCWQVKAKRVETFDVIVTEKLTQAVSVCFEGNDAGKVPVYGKAFEVVTVGDIIEISAMNRTVNGKFREPKFLRRRLDKMAV